MTKRKIVVSVIGSHAKNDEIDKICQEIGHCIAESGAVLLCGGLGGIMEAAARGAKEAGGMTIGLLPGKDKKEANEFIDVALTTGIGYARNALVSCSADLIVAFPGSHGTRSEISYGIVFKKPIIDLGEWNIEGMIQAESLQEAKDQIRENIKKIEMVAE